MGGNIVVNRDYQATGQYISLTAGNGGRGGKVIIQSANVEGIVGPSDLEDFNLNYIENADGGSGGNVLWDNTKQGIGYNLAPLTNFYTADQISLFAGNGGDGVQYAGSGGWAVYWCDRVINEPGEKVTTLMVYGGDGGNVVPNDLPVREAVAGNGGAVVAWGHRGWNGTQAFKKGADGGPVIFEMGDGGNVQQNVNSIISNAGNGGNSEMDRTNLPRELKSITGINRTINYRDPELNIITGNAGSGYSNCEGCRGGDGGNAGVITFGKAGNGGNVYNAPVTDAKAGDGGDLWDVSYGMPGNGGNGKPGGEPGEIPLQYFDPGNAGTGDINEISVDGIWVGKDDIQAFDVGDKGTPGEDCGQDLNCEPVHNDTLLGCWSRIGSTYSWIYKRQQYRFNDSYEKVIWYTIDEEGFATNIGGGTQKLIFTLTYNYADSPAITYTEEDVDKGIVPFGGMTGAQCVDGTLLPPGSGYRKVDRDENPFRIETLTISGCVPTLEEIYSERQIEQLNENCQQ
jgi:hypothetical protein